MAGGITIQSARDLSVHEAFDILHPSDPTEPQRRETAPMDWNDLADRTCA